MRAPTTIKKITKSTDHLSHNARPRNRPTNLKANLIVQHLSFVVSVLIFIINIMIMFVIVVLTSQFSLDCGSIPSILRLGGTLRSLGILTWPKST